MGGGESVSLKRDLWGNNGAGAKVKYKRLLFYHKLFNLDGKKKNHGDFLGINMVFCSQVAKHGM